MFTRFIYAVIALVVLWFVLGYVHFPHADGIMFVGVLLGILYVWRGDHLGA